MHTIKSNSASSASIIAFLAKAGGTYITEALALVSAFASATVLKTGSPKCSVPPFLGVTPPTYSTTHKQKVLSLRKYDIFILLGKRLLKT